LVMIVGFKQVLPSQLSITLHLHWLIWGPNTMRNFARHALAMCCTKRKFLLRNQPFGSTVLNILSFVGCQNWDIIVHASFKTASSWVGLGWCLFPWRVFIVRWSELVRGIWLCDQLLFSRKLCDQWPVFKSNEYASCSFRFSFVPGRARNKAFFHLLSKEKPCLLINRVVFGGKILPLIRYPCLLIECRWHLFSVVRFSDHEFFRERSYQSKSIRNYMPLLQADPYTLLAKENDISWSPQLDAWTIRFGQFYVFESHWDKRNCAVFSV
jgi:hypothetical protein